jgi:hypothetical protein
MSETFAKMEKAAEAAAAAKVEDAMVMEPAK